MEEEGCRLVSSRDGMLFLLTQEEYKCCNVLYAFFSDTCFPVVPVPFYGKDLENFVRVLKKTTNTFACTRIPKDAEERARILTIANYLDCPHIVSMCAWQDAKFLYEEDKKTCEQFKKWRLFTYMWKWL